MLTAVVLVGAGAIVLMQFVDIRFVSEAACQHIDSLNLGGKFTYCFYGEDWDEETYLSAISGFYTALITVLIAVQALVSVLAFVVVKASNKSAIEDQIESELPKYFDSVRAVDRVKSFVESASKDAIAAEAEQLLNRIRGLQGDLEEVQARLFELEENGNAIETEETIAGDGTEEGDAVE